MKKILKLFLFTIILSGLTNITFAENNIPNVIKKDCIFAVYIKAGYFYNLITENIINSLKSNDFKLQNEALHNLARQNLFGITHNTNAENAIKLIKNQEFIPTGNLAFSITSALEGTAYMDIKCNPKALPEYLLNFIKERGIESKLENNELLLSTPSTKQTGIITANKLILGQLQNSLEQTDKSWNSFIQTSIASNTLFTIEADITKIKDAINKNTKVSQDQDFQIINQFINNISRLRLIGNTNKAIFMICVNDEKNRSDLKDMLKSELENIKNMKNEMRPPENGQRPPWFREDAPDPRNIGQFEIPPQKPQKPQRPPRHHDKASNTQKVKDFVSKIIIIDKSPWLGIEIPDFINTVTNDPELLGILTRPPRH